MSNSFLICGDSIDVLPTLEPDTFDACVTDPPYGLGKEPDPHVLLRAWLDEGVNRGTGSGGFMGRAWDAFVPPPALWREVYRVIKPGGHLLCFAGTRTVDYMGMALRLAGFEIRDEIMWCYGQGGAFNEDVGKRLQKAGASPEEVARWSGFKDRLKPAHEPILVARKPLDGTVAECVRRYGTGVMNVEGCRVEMSEEDRQVIENMGGFGKSSYVRQPGVALQLSVEPMQCIDAKPHDKGRYPANVIHDGSPEVVAMFPHKHGAGFAQPPQEKWARATSGSHWIYGGGIGSGPNGARYGDSGPTARFFMSCPFTDEERVEQFLYYCAKASSRERGKENKHPTVKPLSLLRYLVRLVTQPGGLVLDPFSGSGTTALAADAEGMACVAVEREAEYCAVAEARGVPWPR